MATVDFKKWKGFIFFQTSGISVRLTRDLDERTAKQVGVKTLSTVCRQRRIYFVIEFYVNKPIDEVTRLLQSTYGGTACVFNNDEPILNVNFNATTSTFKTATWLDEISGSVVVAPPSFEERGRLLSDITKHVLERYQGIEDKMFEYYEKLQVQEIRMSDLQQRFQAKTSLLTVAEEENTNLKKEIMELVKSNNEGIREKSENVALKQKITVMKSVHDTQVTRIQSLSERVRILESQLSSMSKSQDIRITSIEANYKSAVKGIRADVSKWTEGILDRARIVDTTGHSQTFAFKEPGAKRSLEPNPKGYAKTLTETGAMASAGATALGGANDPANKRLRTSSPICVDTQDIVPSL